MTATVEQLHYTWTPRGIEGINRFQIAAMSPGFTGHVRPALPFVRKICRYERPKADRDANPVSFGWFDHRDYRIAFCRVGLPPVRGKVGNFAAHVLVGSPRSLREADLAMTFGSTFWWSGPSSQDLEDLSAGKRDFELPAVDIDAVLSERPEVSSSDRSIAIALSHTLLTLSPDTRITIVGDAGTFGRALRAVGTHIPEALQGRSLSTYEGTPTFPFKVVGSPVPDPRGYSLSEPPELDGLSQATLYRLLSPPRGHVALGSAVRAGLGPKDTTPDAFWARAREIVHLATDDGPVSSAAALLDSPQAVAYLGAEEKGRAQVAAAVHAQAPGVHSAVKTAAGNLAHEDRAALYAAIARRYASGDMLRGCARAASVLDEGARSALIDGAARNALSNSVAASSLGADDAALLIARVAEGRSGLSQIGPLLRVNAHHVARCAEERSIPDQHIVLMLEHLLPKLSDATQLTSTLLLRPALFAERELGKRERDACFRLLGLLASEPLARALGALLSCLTGPKDVHRTVALLHRLTTTAAARCILDAPALNERVYGALGPTCDDLAGIILVRSLDSREFDAHQRRPLALDLIRRSRSLDHPLASRLLGDLLERSGRAPIEVARQAGALRNESLRVGIFEVAIERALQDLGRAGEVTAIWNELLASHPHVDDAEALHLLLQRAARQRGDLATALLLGWIARDLLPARPKLLSGKRLRDRDLQALVESLVAEIPAWCLEQVADYADGADRHVRGWWRSLLDGPRGQARVPRHPRRA